MIINSVNKVSWTDIKAIKIAKNIPFQYVEDSSAYSVFLQNNSFTLYCRVQKASPRSSDQIDWEDNYKSAANSLLSNFSKLVGATDETKIGNTGDKLKVDASFSGAVNPSLAGSTVRYLDMNASNGGVARNTEISTSYTTIYNYSGSGVMFGFAVSFEGNIIGADAFIIKLTIDGVIVAELNTQDIGSSSVYGLGSNKDADSFGWQVASNNVRFVAPGIGSMRYGSSISIAIKKASGSTKQFRGGLIGLTKE